MVVIMQNTQKSSDVQKMKVNTTKTRKVHANEDKLHTEKNGGYMPNTLGGRLVVGQAGGQVADKILQFAKFLKFDNFNSKAHLGCLNGFRVLIASYQQIHGQYLNEKLL